MKQKKKMKKKKKEIKNSWNERVLSKILVRWHKVHQGNYT